MSDIFIHIPDPNAWVRNPDWLPLPTVNEGDKKFYGLYAIYSGSRNELCLRMSNTTPATVNWGDGVTGSLANTTDVTHVYDYSTITSSISYDSINNPYKQVIVELNFTDTTSVSISREPVPSGSTNVVPWLDIIIDNSDMTAFLPSSPRKPQLLERIRILSSSLGGDQTNIYNYNTSMKVWDVDLTQTTNHTTTFESFGDARDSNGEPLDFLYDSSTTFNNTFFASKLSKIGNVSAISASTFRRCWFQNYNLEEIGYISASSATNISQCFYEDRSLRKAGPIVTSNSLQDIESMFRSCRMLENLEITDCSGVTTTTNFLMFTENIRNVILTGLTVGITIPGSMEKEAIDNLFTSLGTASGSQTITVTGNPGAPTCDTSIATGKGWTVVT